MNPTLDDKITAMLRQLDAAAPTAPSFDDLTTPSRANFGRPNWITLGAAASIVALGVGGLIVLANRDISPPPVADQPIVSVPATNGSAPPADAPEQLGFGGPLIGAALGADDVPLFEVDLPNWRKDYVNGTEELPLGDITTDMIVMVGESGPTYDQPLISVSVFDASGFDVADFGDPIDVNGVASAVMASEVDVDTKLVGPAVNLTVPLSDGRALRVNTVRLGIDETVAIAETVSVTAGGIELPAPPGFRLLPTEPPDGVRHLSYRWVFDDGNPVPEPVVISTPTASEIIDSQPSIEVVGENLGAISLMGRIGLQAGENRVVNGLDVAYRPLPDQPGSYWADWLDGEWSFYAMGLNLDSEVQFIELLESLTIVDAETFASADSGLAVALPGRHDDLALDILGDLQLSSEQFDRASTTSMMTGAYDYRFELYFGLGCVAKQRWLAADAGGDDTGRAAALARVEAANARPDDEFGLPSNVGLSELVASMNDADAASVAEFGSNDCPLWST